MVSFKAIGKAAVSVAKVYIRDAGTAYASAFLGGVMAGAAWTGLKDGIDCGKFVVKAEKKLIGKLVNRKKNEAKEEPKDDPKTGNNPENTQE